MLHAQGHSLLHRTNPLTKLALLGVVATMLPLWSTGWLLLGVALCLACGFVIGLGWPLLRRWLILMVPTGLALAVIHGLLVAHGAPARLSGLAYYPQGLAYGTLVFARLSFLLAAGLLFVMTTRASDLGRALDAAGLPPAISYLLTAPLALVDSITDEARHVRDSLQLRGYSARGSLRSKARMLAAMVNPLVRNLIIEAPMRAELLDMRGFRAMPRRSVERAFPDSGAQVWLRRGLLLIAVVQLALVLL